MSQPITRPDDVPPQQDSLPPDTVVDRPPDPRAAAVAAAKTRRVLRASDGPAWVAAGAYAVVAAFAVALCGWSLRDSTPLLALGGFGLYAITIWLVRRNRCRRGMQAKPAAARQYGSRTESRIFIGFLVAGVVLLIGLLIVQSKGFPPWGRDLWKVTALFICGLALSLLGLARHEWEWVPMGFVFAACVFLPDSLAQNVPPEFRMAVAGLAAIACGIAKQVRWRRWVRSVSDSKLPGAGRPSAATTGGREEHRA